VQSDKFENLLEKREKMIYNIFVKIFSAKEGK